jgi:hypothetical protein
MNILDTVVKIRVRGLVWTGVLSYRRMKITYEKKRMVCPLCKCDLVPHRYFGSYVFQFNPMKSDYRNNFWMPLKENGEVVWFVAPDLVKRKYEYFFDG